MGLDLGGVRRREGMDRQDCLVVSAESFRAPSEQQAGTH